MLGLAGPILRFTNSRLGESDGTGREFTVVVERSIFTGAGDTWLFNAFTLKGAKGPTVDTMGKCETCFVSPQLPVNEAFAEAIAANPSTPASDPAARIVSVRFTNTP